MKLSNLIPIRLRSLTAALAASSLLAVPAMAQAPGLAMLRGLDKGAWQVQFRDGPAPRRVCVRSGKEFIQLAHRGDRCQQFVVSDDASAVDVQYSCSGQGYGRTFIRKETNKLIQVETQGIRDGRPFNYRGEARRTGTC